jgi:hypothetical protein
MWEWDCSAPGRTVYACGDLYAAAWSRALLAEGDPLVAIAEASVRSREGVLSHPVISTGAMSSCTGSPRRM